MENLEHKIVFITSTAKKEFLFGNGVNVDGFIVTAAHVVRGKNFSFNGKSINRSDEICFADTESICSKLLRLLNCRYWRGWTFDDYAIYRSHLHSHLTMANDLPEEGDELLCCSIKCSAQKKNEKESVGIFSSLSVEVHEAHTDIAKVLYKRGNFIFCEMNHMLEQGRSGCPIIKNGKVYGILHGGDDKKICWFQSSVSILKSLKKQGITYG